MLNKNNNNGWLKDIKSNVYLTIMQTTAQIKLNPYHYHLSTEAKKRLRWLHVLYYEQDRNVSRAANKLGISRQWLSSIKSLFEKNNKDPRAIEPKLKTPRDTSNRKRIPKETENKIIEIRDRYFNCWGKEKIARILKRDYGIKVNPNTVNKYLRKHNRIDPKISLKNIKAWKAKKQREADKFVFKVKHRPPDKIKDYAPGALIEKDMKYIEKTRRFINPNKENFYYQHTEIDSFTRIRVIELVENAESKTAASAHKRAITRFPFSVACVNTDNGGENEKDFSDELQKEDLFHFYSNTGTPTDNPRVERSHLTDDKEFYGKGNLFYRDIEKQRQAAAKWEHIYNYERPHQALGYLTPIEFYELWKEDKEKAYAITKKYQTYLIKQKKRLANSRKIKNREQIDNLMKFIDAKLNKKQEIQRSKFNLINCQLCSVA